MTENKANYIITEGTGGDEELKKYKDCFEQNDSEKNLAVLKWFHQENLRKEQSILYALDPQKKTIAAIYTYLPVIVRCMGTKLPALQSFDTLTHHLHRGKGLFILLASTLAEKEAAKGNELVFGFPNEKSIKGFVHKLGFTYFGEVPFLIKPLTISYFIKKVLKKNRPGVADDRDCEIDIEGNFIPSTGSSLKKIDIFGEDYEILWNTIRNSIPIGVNRDAAYMNWRFVNKPHSHYIRYGYYEGTELKGIVIFTLKIKHGGKIGYLMEVLYDPKNTKAGKELLKFSTRVFRKNNADVILAWCYSHSFNYPTFKKSGYYNFPEKIRPQKLGVIVKVLKSTFEKDILKIKNWYFSYSDSDTV